MSEKEIFDTQEASLEAGSEQMIQTVKEAIPANITLALESTDVSISPEEFSVVEASSADVAEVAGFAASENNVARKLASESTLATVLASAEEEPVSQETSVRPQQGSSWLQKKMYIAAAALGMFAAAQPALAGDHNGLREQVRAELQLQAGTAVNNGINSLIQIGVNRIARAADVQMPQQVYGPQPGAVIVGIGGLPPPGVIYQQPGYQNERGQKIQGLQESFNINKGLAEQYYAEIMGYKNAYDTYMASGRSDLAAGSLGLYNNNMPKYLSQRAKAQAAYEALESARSGR